MSVGDGILAHMFDTASDAGLVDLMGQAQRASRVEIARQLLAIGHFSLRRVPECDGENDDKVVDDWEVVAAEIGAELGISRGRASSMMSSGQALIKRLPKVAKVFAAGEIEWQVVNMLIYRTDLMVSEDACALIDAIFADRAAQWNHLSYNKLVEVVDWLVLQIDPDAVRRAKSRDDDRHFDVIPGQYGMADIVACLRGVDGVALSQRLDALAATVCREDPRTHRQRRADAIAAVLAHEDAMACLCERPDCPAAGRTATTVLVHMLAERGTVEGAGTTPGYVSGLGPVPASTVAEVARHAKRRPIEIPDDAAPEPQYRPSTALADFVRSRDLTCRWMNCDRPAWRSDIDHTAPWPHGPTHPSNNACFCRLHHLMKTFYCGPGGWIVRQQPDGAVIFTSPTGRIHTTTPFGAMLFPQLGASTGTLHPPEMPAPTPGRGICMPTRRRSRRQNRERRIQRERALNATIRAENTAPAAQTFGSFYPLGTGPPTDPRVLLDDPPPF